MNRDKRGKRKAARSGHKPNKSGFETPKTERMVTCKKCGWTTPYRTLTAKAANYFIFCPECKGMLFGECERGYGPVTPCDFYYRDEVVGNVVNVVADAKNHYILYAHLLPEKVHLKNSYYDALLEAFEIIQKLI